MSLGRVGARHEPWPSRCKAKTFESSTWGPTGAREGADGEKGPVRGPEGEPAEVFWVCLDAPSYVCIKRVIQCLDPAPTRWW
jgi:hypothetical protein